MEGSIYDMLGRGYMDLYEMCTLKEILEALVYKVNVNGLCVSIDIAHAL